jgi:hypothetical protein
MPKGEVVPMQQSITADRHFVEQGFTGDKRFVEERFAVDKGFVVFLLVMTLLFILFGIMADPGSFVPPDYQTFW